MSFRRLALPLYLILFASLTQRLAAQDQANAVLHRQEAQDFHFRAMQRTGILVPMYLYPSNVHTNDVFNRLIELKRRYETVPVWVIVNPASGPGSSVDANYTKAIDRLRGAGCVVLGYVSTRYAKRSKDEVGSDIDRWRAMYPRTHGIFFDEMVYEDTASAVGHQASLKQYASDAGFWPTVANPGTDVPGRYFAANVADVIVIHESKEWPTEEKLHGNFFGGYSDHPPFKRAVLIYGQSSLDTDKLKMVRRHARWIYVTEDQYQLDDPDAPNPWDVLSKYMETMCEELAK